MREATPEKANGLAVYNENRQTVLKDNKQSTSDLSRDELENICKSNPEFEHTRDEVKREFAVSVRALLEKRKDLILRLGQAIIKYAKGAVRTQDTCSAIKFFLSDEIEEGLISERDISRYCPAEWKKNTRPVKDQCTSEKDKLSFSHSGSSPSEGNGCGLQKQSMVLAGPEKEREDEGELEDKNNRTGRGAQTIQDICPQHDELEAINKEQVTEIERLKAETHSKRTEIERLIQENEDLRQKTLEPSTEQRIGNAIPAQAATKKTAFDEQRHLLEPFTTTASIELRGNIIPLVVEVTPTSKRVHVSIDKKRAQETGFFWSFY